MARRGGNPDFMRIRNTDTAASVRQRQRDADDFAREMAPAVAEFRTEFTAHCYRDYADWLNAKGYRTRRGKVWTPRAVSKLIKRLTAPGFRLAP